MTRPVLDRRVQFDERSRQYPARALLPLADIPMLPRSYTWNVPEPNEVFPLDQGAEGACVGHAWAHEAAARPVVVEGVDSAAAFSLYHRAQALDGEDWVSGTSVLAGAKAMKEKGWLDEYRWAFTPMDALNVISRHGPAVLGINWYEGMWEPNEAGFIEPTGAVVGGHAILAIGVNVKRKTVTLYNSWGPDWGFGGQAFISWKTFERLLVENGECCVPVRR